MQPKLSHQLGQRLALTPQLTQSLKILAMNAVELDAFIEDCLQSNPLLEVDERPAQETSTHAIHDDGEPWQEKREFGDNRWEAMYTHANGFDGTEMRGQQWEAQPSILQSLREQVGRQPMPDRDRTVALAVIDSLDDDGYFRIDAAELAADLRCRVETVNRVLESIVQQLEPAGIGARNVVECLLLQLDGNDACEALARRLLLQFPEHLFESDAQLAARVGCGIEDLAMARHRLRRLDPYPGHGTHGMQDIYVRPEIIFHRQGTGEFQIEIPVYNWHGLRLSRRWQGRRWQGADREFMRNSLREAKWLLYAMEQRRETLFKVGKCLASCQRDFLEYGPLGLKPLTLQDVASDVGLHESTISRVTNGKYAQTPLGLIELRRFFSAGLPLRGGGAISVCRVQQRIRALIAAEPAHKPISDQEISERLHAEGIDIARRTVAKYREAMGLPSSSRRRRLAAGKRPEKEERR